LSLQPREQGLAATIRLFSRDGLVLFSDAWAFHDTECNRRRPLIIVSCEPDGDDWRCTVTIGGDPAATRHQVAVSDEDLVRLAPTGTSVERMVEASFAFLLEREPRESILRRFDLSEISRYFPEYEPELRKALDG
jgi:hypothetical protein